MEETFAQVLEGLEAAIIDLNYEKSTKDARDFGLMVCIQRKVKEREFPEWPIGFHSSIGVKGVQLPRFKKLNT